MHLVFDNIAIISVLLRMLNLVTRETKSRVTRGGLQNYSGRKLESAGEIARTCTHLVNFLLNPVHTEMLKLSRRLHFDLLIKFTE